MVGHALEHVGFVVEFGQPVSGAENDADNLGERNQEIHYLRNEK
jgi:hypothetical protein